ncbi:GNAT family N-acetyltransferase [Kamptonema cortianum]|nr:GNAT family N-acetyltransferase [Kamptonema cortianum]
MPVTHQLHRAKESDLPLLDDLWRKVYGGDGSFSENPYGENREIFFGTVDGEVAFATIVHDLPLVIRGVTVRCAGIGAVATLPEYRTKKVGTHFLGELLKVAAGDGFAISSLYGFRETFYRRLGFESCGYRWQLRVEEHRLPNLESDLAVRRVALEEVSDLNDCFERFIAGFSGGCLRSEARWRRRLGKVPPSVFALGDPVEAYLWCDPSGFF